MRTSRWICCVSLAWCGAALAQSGEGSLERAASKHLQGAEMNATLSQTVDARKAKPGDEVTATLTDDVRANGRLLLFKGTILVGRVTEAQARTRAGDASSDSRLGIAFENAVLRDGQQVPINATIEAVAEPAASSASRSGEDAARGQLASGMRGVFGIAGVQIVAMAAADGRAPLLVSSTGNVALKSGTQLLLVARGERAAGAESAGNAAGRGSDASHAAGASTGLGATGS
jgi:hypothetical protein